VIALSRLLSAEQYGQYVSVLVLAGLCQSAGFNWLQSAIIRLHPEETDEIGRAEFARAVRVGFLLSAVAVSIAWTIGLGILEAFTARAMLPAIIGWAVLLCGAWAAVGSSWNRMTAPQWRFLTAQTVQSLGGLVFAVAGLALWPGEVLVPLLALAIASLLAAAVASFPITGSFRGRQIQPRLRQIWTYGAPLTAVTLANLMLATADRLLVAYSISPAAAGAYAVAAGIAGRSMVLLLLPIAAATRPHIFMELNRSGKDAARRMLQRMSGWLVAVGLPLAVVFVCVPRLIASTITVGQLAEQAAEVLPWTGIGALLSALLTFHVATAFQLERRTDRLLVAVVPAVALNIGSNLLLLPRFGIAAAGWTMVVSNIVALALALWMGRRFARIPFSFSDAFRTSLACIPLALFLQLEFAATPAGFVAMVSGGALLYAVAAIGLNVVDSRKYVFALARKYRRPTRG
jgi:O-antigen/teichoic acid export membrane protein